MEEEEKTWNEARFGCSIIEFLRMRERAYQMRHPSEMESNGVLTMIFQNIQFRVSKNKSDTLLNCMSVRLSMRAR